MSQETNEGRHRQPRDKIAALAAKGEKTPHRADNNAHVEPDAQNAGFRSDPQQDVVDGQFILPQIVMLFEREKIIPRTDTEDRVHLQEAERELVFLEPDG